MKQRRVVSLTDALLGQSLFGIIEDLLAVRRDLGSVGRHSRRSVATSLNASVEQAARFVISLKLQEDDRTMPHLLVIETASMRGAADLSLADLASLTYNFQRVAAIVGAFDEHGIDNPFKGDTDLFNGMVRLTRDRNDLVHTSSDMDFDMPAAYRDAVRFVFKVFAQFPVTEADARLMQGDILREMRLEDESREAYETAAKLCEKLVENSKDDARALARALAQTGLALAGLGRHEDALARFDKSIGKDAGRAATHLGRAQALAKLGRGGDALAACDRAVGLYASELEDARSSEDPAMRGRHAAELAGFLSEAYLRRGRLLAGMGRADEALASCDMAVAKDGSMHRAHLLRGDLLAGMGRADEALAAYDRATDLGRHDEDAHLQRAGILADMGRADEALAAYDRAIELDGGYAEAHARKAEFLATLGRDDDALYFYNRAIKHGPRHADALVGKARILERLGRSDEAVECYDAAHALDPGRYQ